MTHDLTEAAAPAPSPASAARPEDAYFSTERLKSGLGARAARGGVVTLVAQGLKFAIFTAATVVLARLLTPQDYGLVGMVTILVSFVGMFQYLGLSTATVQWPELTHRQVSTLFWVNLGLSGGIALGVAACSPLVAWFYGEPRLVAVTLGLAGATMLRGLSIQHEALLVRQMRFTTLAANDLVAMLVGLASAVTVALRGWGYWALVVNQLAMTGSTAAGVWLACRWRPGLPGRGVGLRRMLSFGGNLTGFNLVNFVARNVDNLLIGKVWGAYQLGIYARAYQMLLLPLDQVNAPFGAVAVPALSRLGEEPERYRAAFLKVVEKIAMLTMPGVAFMIGVADWLVRLMLGAQWEESARVFMLLGAAALVQPLAKAALWLYTTQGRTREMFRWGWVGGGIAVASILAGLPWGALGVATSYALTDLFLTTPLLFWLACRRGPVRAGDIYRAAAPSACAAVCSLSAVYAARPWLVALPLAARLAAAFAVAALASLAVLWVIPAGRRALRQVVGTLLTLLRTRRDGATAA
ncbi:MAG: lipopolysaccharide biosynthesis protein [Pyrinomonadaceae bacterium]